MKSTSRKAESYALNARVTTATSQIQEKAQTTLKSEEENAIIAALNGIQKRLFRIAAVGKRKNL